MAAETLATWRGTGKYDLPCEIRIVRREDEHYIIADSYNGEDDVRGGAYRPSVYRLPGDQVSRAVDLITHGADWDESSYNSPVRKIQVFELEILARCLRSQLAGEA